MEISEARYKRICLEVQTRNIVNAKANEVRKAFHDFFYPEYLGKKVLIETSSTYGGKWSKKVREKLNALEAELGLTNNPGSGFRLVFTFYHTTVYGCIDTTYPAGNYGVNYVKKDFVVCNVDHDIVVELNEFHDATLHPFKTDYHPESIRDAILKVAELEEAISKERSKYWEINIS